MSPGPGARAASAALLVLAIGLGCAHAPAPVPASPGDPEVALRVESWKALAASRRALRARARLAVDAPGAGPDGADLSLRSQQRLWLARPGRLRVEVLGLLDQALAVLAVDGERYALLQAAERRLERGEVYPGLLWDVARLDLSTREAVALLLGAPQTEGWQLAGAYRIGEALTLVFAEAGAEDGVPGPGLEAEFGRGGELQRLERRDAQGRSLWQARYSDFLELDGTAFAREVAVRSRGARARVVLRGVELNPSLAPDVFAVAP